MHISKARQLLGLLNFACYQELRVKWRELIFCLLEVHSLGPGRSPAHSLGCHAEGSLSHLTPHHHHHPFTHPSFTHSLSFSLSAWRLPLLQLTLVLPLLGEMCAEPLTSGLIFLLFPISSISSSWRLWRRQRMGRGVGIRGLGGGRSGRRENIVNSHHLFKLTMFAAAKE